MKRIHLKQLQKYDLDNNVSIVRELDMHVDGVLIRTDYALQFWRDVELYGIREALLYLKNQNTTVLGKPRSIHKGADSEEMKELEAFITSIEALMV